MAMTKKNWVNLKETDPEKYAEINKKQKENRKAVMDKKLADPVWHADWIKKMVEGRAKAREAKKEAEEAAKRAEIEAEEFWSDVTIWTLQVAKERSEERNALRLIAKLIKPYRLRKLKEGKEERQQEIKKRFYEAHPNYQREYFQKNGGWRAIRERAKAKHDQKQKALEHLKLTTMTEEEKERFRYDNSLMDSTEHRHYRGKLKRRNLPIEKTPFTKPKPIIAIFNKPAQQMTLAEMQRAAGGP
jgi:hypothetical protein